MGAHILIVEDDKKLNEGIKIALQGSADRLTQCRTLTEARTVISKDRLDLIVLDVNLPDGNGIDFVKEIRRSSRIPIILLTINNMEMDIVMGLESGANDYITKPFSLAVLRARAAVQLRERGNSNQNGIQLDRFDFHFDKMEFFKDGIPIELSKTEQRLLRILCGNRGRVLERSSLIDQIWQGDTEFVDEHALTVTVKRLRDKLEDDSKNPRYIKTVYGIGYTWAVDR